MYRFTHSIVVMTLFVFLALASAQAETVEVLTGEWAPFVSQELPEYGYTAEIVTAAFKAAGVTPKHTFDSWSRIETLVKKGDAFAAYPYLKTPEREKFAYFSEQFAQSRNVFFYSKTHNKGFDFSNLDKLGNMRVGGLRGYFYVDSMRKAGITLDYTRFPRLSFKKLLHGRIDLFPSNELVGWELIKKHFPDRKDDFSATETAFSESGLYLMVSRSYPDAKSMLQTFNKGLATIKENGVYDKILKKYGLSS